MSRGYRVPVAEEDRVRAQLAVHTVAAARGASLSGMERAARLTGAACETRRLALYLAHVSFDWPVERVGHVFGLSRTTVSTACRWVEDARDRPALDRLLDRLEACVRRIVGLTAGDIA